MGLSPGGWTVLEGLGLTSIGKAAYSITSPGEPVTEAVFREWLTENAAGLTLGDQSCVKRLVFEAQTFGCGRFERPSYWVPELHSQEGS